MKLVNAALVSLLSLSASSAFAEGESATGLFLEPGISYQMTSSNINNPAPFTNSSAQTKGFGVLLRGGIHVYDRFFVAADARYALLNYNDNANNMSVPATSYDIAPVVGFQMKDYGVRIFGGYILAGDLDPKGANGFDYRFDDANGWRVGASLKLQSFSVNIEWQRLHYATTKVTSPGALGTNADQIGSKYNGEGIVASVTFPIEFN